MLAPKLPPSPSTRLFPKIWMRQTGAESLRKGTEDRQRLFSAGLIEDVLLFDLFPAQFAALRTQLIAPPSEFIFLEQVLLARGKPFSL